MPKVSIILTSFNHAKYLREAIESALNQTFTDFELIIWDDASSDDSWEIIQSYHDTRIKAFRNDEQRRGVFGINKAISDVAQGEYIAIHHSDDVWELEKLEKQAAFLDSHADIGAVFTNAFVIDEDGFPLTDEKHFYYNIFDQSNKTRYEWLRHFFIKGNALCHPSVLIRKACYENCGLYRLGFGQLGDFDMWIRLALKYEIHVFPDKLIRFRVRNDEANTSGNRPETRSRHCFEYSLLLSNYLGIENINDLIRIFPEARKYCNGKDPVLRYALAMAIIELRPFYFARQFALNILFELLNNPYEKKLLAFDVRDFIKLTGELDPLRVVHVEQLTSAVVERDEQISSLTHAVSERDEQISSLTHAVSERDEQISSLTHAVSERDVVRAEARALKASVEQIHQSHSWRLTRPLRWTGDRLRLIRQMSPALLFSQVFRLCVAELQRHGLRGTIRRLPYYYHRRVLVWNLLRHRNRGAAQTWAFSAEPVVSRPIRLHPDLTREVRPIAATVSVVIPTLNPGPEFSMLLHKLRGQQGLKDLEVVIVDSGSTDGSVDVARQWGCIMVEIAPDQFSHSGARNLGATHAKGDYLLFMVQDAYPIGEHWVYGMLRYLLDHAEQNLVAVSCAETPRSDSDMMYDSMIDTHYRFLGCHDQDRLGRLQGADHMALRSQGQLSDVACLIRRQEFEKYHYRGDYAEDLDLGMRIIRDGKAVAMLASVKVIHSHNRSPFYYLKRSFVDVVFLVDKFDDFPLPSVRSVANLIGAIHWVAQHLSRWLQAAPATSAEGDMLGEVLQGWVKGWRNDLLAMPASTQKLYLGDQHLEEALASLLRRVTEFPELQAGSGEHDAQQFVDMFLGRMEHFGRYASRVYGRLDSRLSSELTHAVVKIFAAAVGSALGFAYVQIKDGPQPDADLVQSIFTEFRAGV